MTYTLEVPKNESLSQLFTDRHFDISHIIQQGVVVQEKRGLEKAIEIENLFTVPSNIHLAASSETITFRAHREKILHNHLRKIERRFDYILVDCPPTLGVLTVNAIFAADLLLIPTCYSKYSLDGISDLFTSIAEVKETESYEYRILRNNKDMRSKRTNDAIEHQLSSFREHLFDTVIRRSEAINQAQMLNQPIFIFDPRSSGVEDFSLLTKEVLKYGQEARSEN